MTEYAKLFQAILRDSGYRLKEFGWRDSDRHLEDFLGYAERLWRVYLTDSDKLGGALLRDSERGWRESLAGIESTSSDPAASKSF